MGVDRSAILHQAQLLASKGNLDGALAEWKKLVQESPNDGTIHNSIGDLHVKRHAKAEAITAYLQAAKVFRDEGASLKAIAAYKKVLKLDPARYDVYRYLGDLNAERGLLSSAVSDYLTLAKFYLKEKKFKEALEIYRLIVSQDPSNLDAQQRVAELCLKENLPTEAVEVYLQIGRERSAQGRTSEAREAYAIVLKHDPENREAEQFLHADKQGAAEARSVEAPKGPRDASKAVSSHPADMLGEARRRLMAGQYEGAEAILSQLLSREPGNPEICRLLAQLHLKQGQVHVALNEYRFLAGSALRSQDYELAESLINEFLDVEPQSVPLLELLGDLYEEKGDAATAAMHLGKAIAILQERPDPQLPSLPVELYDRIRTLDPHGQVRKHWAAQFEPAAAPAGQSESRAGLSDQAGIAGVPETEGQDESAEDKPLIIAPVASAGNASPAEALSGQDDAKAASLSGRAVPADAPSLAVPEPDSSTRYALGIAFRKMGLPEEALEELELASRDADLWVDASIAKALCWKDLGRFDAALSLFEEVQQHPGAIDDKARMIQYELALLYKATDSTEKALALFEAVADYQDAREHLAVLRAPQSSPVQ